VSPVWVGVIGHLVKRAILFVADLLTEADVRRRQEKIRATQRKLLAAQADIRKLARDRRVERARREYLRRQALIAYRKAQRELLQIGIDALQDAKKVAFTKLSSVQDRMEGRSAQPRSYIDRSLFEEFHALKRQMHETIAESKALTTALCARRREVQTELDALYDDSTHKRLGAKKKIQVLLDELHADGRTLFASNDARGSMLRLHHVAYVLERRCGACRAWVSPAMAFCPMCGAEREEREPVRFFKKDVKDVHACPECHAPTAEELVYCFNCGEELDLFGLKAAL
jgi:RNA polymerase subunit RPABC4/transcription elongation factor Spt4